MALAFQSGGHAFRPHIRIAVHVSANPGAKAHNGAGQVFPRTGPVGRLQGHGQALVEARQDAIDHLRQMEDHILHFVGHRGAGGGLLLRLPGQFNLPPQLLLDARLFPRRGIRLVQADEQGAGHALALGQQGASHRPGGMCGEHRHDFHLRQGVPHLGQPQALRRQFAQHGHQTAGLGRRIRARLLAATADAVNLLRQIHQREEGREGPRQFPGGGGGQAAQLAGQFAIRVGRSSPALPRGAAGQFNPLQQGGATQIGDHLAQHASQEAHIVPQGLIGGLLLQGGGRGLAHGISF